MGIPPGRPSAPSIRPQTRHKRETSRRIRCTSLTRYLLTLLGPPAVLDKVQSNGYRVQHGATFVSQRHRSSFGCASIYRKRPAPPSCAASYTGTTHYLRHYAFTLHCITLHLLWLLPTLVDSLFLRVFSARASSRLSLTLSLRRRVAIHTGSRLIAAEGTALSG